MTIDVFLSVGRAGTPDQERFLVSLESALRGSGVAPRTVGRNDFSSKAPLKRVGEVLGECHGTVVLAYERSRSAETIERPGSPTESVSRNVRLPTVWNQIEAAMSYSVGLPLLVIVEEGLQDEGLLESRYDWYVQWVKIDELALGTNEFRSVLADWIKAVAEHDRQSQTAPRAGTMRDPSEITLRELLGTLTVPQLWAGLTGVAAVLIAVAGIAFKVGASS
jgi:hypothetical protein